VPAVRRRGAAAEGAAGATGRAAQDTWYVRFWPTYYILDREGRIRYKGSWEEDMALVARVVEGLLPPPR
jgi:hypothetical protein